MNENKATHIKNTNSLSLKHRNQQVILSKHTHLKGQTRINVNARLS